MTLVAPSILSADFACLGEEVKRLEKAGADCVHIDVMDGQFVPNLTIGAPVVKALRKETNLPFDVHLMIQHPENLIPDFIQAGADWISVHAEACVHLHRVRQMIHEGGKKAGVALNPATPLTSVQYLLKDVDYILLMTVNPGFGGQPFIRHVLPKIQELRQMIREQADERPIYIEVDGGVNQETGTLCVQAGADILVAGSYVFSYTELEKPIRQLQTLHSSL